MRCRKSSFKFQGKIRSDWAFASHTRACGIQPDNPSTERGAFQQTDNLLREFFSTDGCMYYSVQETAAVGLWSVRFCTAGKGRNTRGEECATA